MNLLAVKPGIEAYGIYLPLFIFLHSSSGRRERGVKPVAAGGGWKDQCVAHLGHLGSSWPAAERNFGLAAMMGWGEPRRIAPSSSFFATNCLACFGPLSPKPSPQAAAKKAPGVASFGFASPFFPFQKRSKTDDKKGALASPTAPAELCPPLKPKWVLSWQWDGGGATMRLNLARGCFHLISLPLPTIVQACTGPGWAIAFYCSV